MKNQSVPPQVTFGLEYATGRLNVKSRWGKASIVRGIITMIVMAYMFFSVYAWIPRDRMRVILVWPPTLAVCLSGIIYGMLGLQRDADRRWARWGLWINFALILFVLLGTWEAIDDISRAFRYTGGIIDQSHDR